MQNAQHAMTSSSAEGRAAVAFIWHMHQPAYVDPDGREPILPWARLHATGAYFDMAWLHARHPQMRSTVNFVPVLLDQLEAYLGGRRDRFWTLSRMPARDLSADDRAFLLAHFFSVHTERGVRHRPRFWSLYNRREDGVQTFSDADFRDLQTLFNLSWFGAAARVEYPVLAAMEQKGRGFREDEKRKILDIQIAVLRRVLDLYRQLATTGRIELICSPYHHPILPLLIDSDQMARALPDAPRPTRFAWPQDARAQVRDGRARHAEVFGAPARGMWPAEGAVSPEACALLVDEGVGWIATDEAQLFAALPVDAPRDALYQPYTLDTAKGPLTVIFRDRTLSDLIGFTYAQQAPEAAAADLVGRIKRIGQGGDASTLVTIALDGENPWEAYVQHGAAFLVAVFAALDADPDLHATTVSAHLADHPPQRRLATIGSGSWINGDYGIWIGKPVENTAWDLLGQTRAAVEAADSAHRAAAMAHVYAAEGSDWFWWYGEPFHSNQDMEFDALFRGRLKAAWRAIGAVPPSVLDQPLARASQIEAAPPRRLITPRFAAGPSTYYEWSGAGSLPLTRMGAMHQAHPVHGRLRYGFDLENAYLRLEPAPGATPATTRVTLGDAVLEVQPDGSVQAEGPVQHKLYAGVLELGVPFTAANATPGTLLPVVIEVFRDGLRVARHPSAGAIDLPVPAADHALLHWSA